jgi:DNA-binding NtrC family response regulator
LGDRFDLVCCLNGEDALAALENNHAEVVLVDAVMPGMNGIELLVRIRNRRDAPPVIIITGVPTPDLAARAIHLGAADFVVKPVDIDTLMQKIAAALIPSRLTDVSRTMMPDFLGESDVIDVVRRHVVRAAKSSLPVVIHGETGVGKEIVARYIHDLSGRKDSRHVVLNCSAFPDTLFDSEMFGVEKGAFTDAVSRPGVFEQADGGTLFLDEITEMSLYAQSKLLRVLEDGVVRHLGSSRVFTIDTRLITASHQNLAGAVEAGTFRQDLYYRLSVIRIDVPPLRDRKQDIPILSQHFLDCYRKNQAGRTELSVSSDRFDQSPERFSMCALEKLTEHRWPGNVRELRNVIYRSATFASSSILRAGDLLFD